MQNRVEGVKSSVKTLKKSVELLDAFLTALVHRGTGYRLSERSSGAEEPAEGSGGSGAGGGASPSPSPSGE